MLQSMPDASPVKWNIAHTSWFFETFILAPHAPDYALFDPHFGYLFNSYYNRIGEMHPRPIRGLVSRPSLDHVHSYRQHVNEALMRFVEKADDRAIEKISPLLALGCAHEEQHQELLITDLQHAMSYNVAALKIYDDASASADHVAPALEWISFEGGLKEIGWNGKGFAFDNEGPRHRTYLYPYELASRPVTKGEFIAFIEDGGYETPDHWLSDGWEKVRSEDWRAPLYWRRADGAWRAYSLFGERKIDPHAPVCHLSYYEAAAYASWAGLRLPTEFEWEAACEGVKAKGNFMAAGAPRSPCAAASDGLAQLFGDVWEWTASAYLPFPGYETPPGAVGEYNGKFMSGQMVLKGGSCATPEGHIRASYRNFFPPAARWQFSGVRLARDAN